MKWSHERLIHLSHLFLESLRKSPRVEFRTEANEIRLQIVRTLKRELERGGEMEEAARRKIASQKRRIPEGSPEWDILFQKYYEEERRKRFGPQ